jgi:hypothetical protein
MTARKNGLHTLRTTYVPLFKKSGAIPVFLDTHAYFDYTGETHDVPIFTSVTYEGCQPVRCCPSLQRGKTPVAPSGIVFFVRVEEDHTMGNPFSQ